MYEVIVTVAGEDGSIETFTLNLVSQLEFEEIETVGSLLEAFIKGISRKHELRLAWLAYKQVGRTVPADLKTFAAQIKSVDAKLEKAPFGETAPTA